MAVKGEGMRVKVGIHVLVKVKEVMKGGKSFVMKFHFDVRWLKNTVEVTYNYGELLASLL